MSVVVETLVSIGGRTSRVRRRRVQHVAIMTQLPKSQARLVSDLAAAQRQLESTLAAAQQKGDLEAALAEAHDQLDQLRADAADTGRQAASQAVRHLPAAACAILQLDCARCSFGGPLSAKLSPQAHVFLLESWFCSRAVSVPLAR